jgi:hypothetical protein
VADTPEAIAYEASVRAIEWQWATLEGIRARAATLLAAASLVTAFLGGQNISALNVGFWEAAAITLFLGAVALCLMILWPQGDWTFALSASILLEDHAETRPPTPVPEMQSSLARAIERHYDANQKKINRLANYFRWASLCLSLEVVAWFL